MKKVLYILPGWEETCKDKPYQDLKMAAEAVGFSVIGKDINWKKPLSEQIFKVPKNATIFGFSLGAILAWLVAQKYPFKHLVLASMTPHYSFQKPKIKKALIALTGKEFVEDILFHLNHIHQASDQTIMYGDKEKEKADILVKNTGHRVNRNYIQAVIDLLG